MFVSVHFAYNVIASVTVSFATSNSDPSSNVEVVYQPANVYLIVWVDSLVGAVNAASFWPSSTVCAVIAVPPFDSNVTAYKLVSTHFA